VTTTLKYQARVSGHITKQASAVLLERNETTIQAKATDAERSPDRLCDPDSFRFGDLIENGYASAENPHRVMIYIRRGVREGRMNSGPYIELTAGRGRLMTFSTSGEHRLRKVGVWSGDRTTEDTGKDSA
jgi:hypothetical protein